MIFENVYYNVTPQQREWIAQKIREDFDIYHEAHQFDIRQSLIDMALHFDLYDLAKEMQSDNLVHS